MSVENRIYKKKLEETSEILLKAINYYNSPFSNYFGTTKINNFEYLKIIKTAIRSKKIVYMQYDIGNIPLVEKHRKLFVREIDKKLHKIQVEIYEYSE